MWNRVIASQRVRAERGPMTGSAKQSRAERKTLDCFVPPAQNCFAILSRAPRKDGVGCLKFESESLVGSDYVRRSFNEAKAEACPPPRITMSQHGAHGAVRLCPPYRSESGSRRLSPSAEGGRTRSPILTILTILWRCDRPHFSSRTSLARGSGKKPSTVLAEHHAAKGSGNADSRPNRWDSGEGGRSRRRSLSPGCVAAHPAHRRASPPYLPLRADWAVCAWALRGCARCQNPSAPT
jgi:hypothetical protein